jgi:hypothetical protein
MQELECKNKQGNPPQFGGFGLFFFEKHRFALKKPNQLYKNSW